MTNSTGKQTSALGLKDPGHPPSSLCTASMSQRALNWTAWSSPPANRMTNPFLSRKCFSRVDLYQVKYVWPTDISCTNFFEMFDRRHFLSIRSLSNPIFLIWPTFGAVTETRNSSVFTFHSTQLCQIQCSCQPFSYFRSLYLNEQTARTRNVNKSHGHLNGYHLSLWSWTDPGLTPT